MRPSEAVQLNLSSLIILIRVHLQSVGFVLFELIDILMHRVVEYSEGITILCNSTNLMRFKLLSARVMRLLNEYK